MIEWETDAQKELRLKDERQLKEEVYRQLRHEMLYRYDINRGECGYGGESVRGDYDYEY